MKIFKLIIYFFIFSIFSFLVFATTLNYVNKDNFRINVEFNQLANITFSKLNDQNIFFLPKNPINNYYSKNFYNDTNIVIENIYTLNLSAKNQHQNILKNDFYRYDFVFDKTKPNFILMIPNNNSLINEKFKTIKINYDEAIDLESCNLNFLIGSGSFSNLNYQGYDPKKIKFDIEFNDLNQHYKILFSCSDFAGNFKDLIIEYDLFILDTILVDPLHGYSSTEEFDVKLNTTNNAICSYYVNYFDDKNLENADYIDFHETGNLEHLLLDFRLEENLGKTELFVKCNYTNIDKITYDFFNLSVDSNPLIIDVVASDIISKPLFSDVGIILNKVGQCRYSLEQESFSEMVQLDNDNFNTEFKITKEVEDSEEYTYYISCKSKAGLITNATANFIVETGLNINLDIIEPKKNYYFENNLDINAKTSHEAQCFYSLNSSNISKNKGTFGNLTKEHIANENFLDGENKLWVKCNFISQDGIKPGVTKNKLVIIDKAKPIINYVNITQPFVSNNKIWDKNKINVNLNVNLTKSGFKKVFYLINSSDDSYSSGWIERNNLNVVLNKDSQNNNLNLTDLKTYYVYSKIVSGSNIVSEIKRSESLFLNQSLKPDHCENNNFDVGLESDIDCGLHCPPCENGVRCFTDNDCLLSNCVQTDSGKICKEPSCFDGIKNQDETGVDCGGLNCVPCKSGNVCLIDSDCLSSSCVKNVCEEINICENGEPDYEKGETDIDCGGPCEACEINKKCNLDNDCQESLVCQRGFCLYNIDGSCVPKCEEGFECKNNECVKISTLINECDPRCSIGYSCINGKCIKDEDPNKDVDKDKFPIWLILLIIFLIIILTLVILYFIFKGKTVTIFSKTIFIPDYFKSVNLDYFSNKFTNKHLPIKSNDSLKYQVKFKPINTQKQMPENKTNMSYYYNNSSNTKEMINLIRQKREEQMKKEQDLIKNKFKK
ncbi:MAG: hypothetical protein ACLFPJ_01385 [Candidatus Woesearchaeota archaeon]